MKNKSNQITLVYLIIALFAVVVFHKLSLKYIQAENYPSFNFIKDIILVTFTGLIFRSILSENNKKNKTVFEKLKKINNEIKESNDKYDIVAKATSDTIWDWNIIEDKLHWNRGIKGIYGYDQNQVGDSSSWWFQNIHPEDSIRMSIKLYSFIEQKTENWQDEYRFKCADGTYKYVLDRGFLLKDETGKAIRMIGAIQDITKRKEEELRLKLLETVILQTKDSIIITEAHFNKIKLPKIVYVNPAFTTMTGYQSDEILHRSPDFLSGPNTEIKTIKKIIAAVKNQEECVVEMISYKKNGEEFWLHFSMIPIHNSDKEISHWISIQRDITEEKRQEKEKEQLIRELTKNNKDLKQFSYITSHNLRAPISNLIGLLSLIEDITIEDIELKEILHGFNKSTHQLSETINDLTNVMIIKDKTATEKETVFLNDVFEHVFNQLSSQIEKYRPILKIDFSKVPALNINKPYIESILLNLLSNALKYKSDKRPLKVNIAAEQVDNIITLTFKDNGIGIDLARNKDKVFGLYQRFHDHPDSKGLGLYLVKSQVEALGGTISVDSEVDKGTTFTLTFINK
ncbi:PAS domain-containing protein [Flavobacterium sp. NG2]|uniref:PAS domain-containing protein n=1 Tax=Flavobacterium sp. NG2 TaxID=3097547 RepID=UPI002A7F6F5D|nr:PAS domain-containing protein [Flavobacterium sp. NG2]WPR71009.1 PAS domain-containing protein [Flavobacterium sp. NG2]